MSNTKTTLKRRLIAGVALALTAVLALSGCGSGSAEKTASAAESNNSQVRTIHAVTGGGPAPYVFRDGNKLTGQNVELVEAIFKKLPQYKLQWDIVDFSAIFSGLDSGRYQIGVNNFAWNKERAAKYLYSDPIYEIPYVIEVPKGSKITATEIDSFGDLAGKTALLDPGTAATTAVQNWNEAHPDQKINEQYTGTGSDLTSKLRTLASGKVDFAIDDAPVLSYYSKKAGLDIRSITIGGDAATSITGTDPNHYLIFPKGEEQLAKDINKAFAEVVKDGDSASINQKWLGKDFTAKQDDK